MIFISEKINLWHRFYKVQYISDIMRGETQTQTKTKAKQPQYR